MSGEKGFLLGKFLPPHVGHVLMCDFARAYAKSLTILVCTLDREPIDGKLRHAWMTELFPDCRVLHFSEDVPQEPSESPDFWPIWRDIVKRFHPDPIDYVFASETYGHRLAAEVGGRFVPVDISREAIPVSGREIRDNPFLYWHRIPAPVRPYFVKRVCIFGPESTGKSTLARQLAKRFDTIFVPEYGRTYTERFGTECNDADLRNIALGHTALTKAAERQANRILILDTDPVLTAVWSDMLLGRREAWHADFTDTADLYLLTDADVPWVDDGTRYFPNIAERQKFMAACKTELEDRKLPYVLLSGSWDDRLHHAVDAIKSRFYRD